jgi:hypothetical protein
MIVTDPLDREADPTHWPVGLFIHTWQDENLHYQGQVRSRGADGKLWVQLLSFMDGSNTKVESIDPATTVITYYATNGAMLDAFDEHQLRTDRDARGHIGDGREFVKLMRAPK